MLIAVGRLRNFVVGVTNIRPSRSSPPVRGSYPLCARYVGVPPADSIITLRCDPNTPAGRYVIVQLPEIDYLEICELEVLEGQS